MRIFQFAFGFITALWIANASAATTTITIYKTDQFNQKSPIGKVFAQDTDFGLLLKPNLKGLPPGKHGFHIHDKPSCDQVGMAAAGHYDPRNTGKHLGPYNDNGHLGDLPVLEVDKNGMANKPVLAPRLTVKQIKGHALMIHAGGDNYKDTPEKLGGGGARIACGVIQK